MQETAEAALGYLRRGWSVIPLRPRDKRPLLAWQRFQTTRASEAEASSWWTRQPEANVGVVTGTISGIVVLDLDGEPGRQSVEGMQLPATPIARTGHGWHYYFKHPGGQVENAVGLLSGVDVRGDGGYVVAPPSTHQSGVRYQWLLEPFETPLADLPDWLRRTGGGAATQAPPRKAGNWPLLLRTQVPEGRRNQTLTRIAGYLLRDSRLGAESALELAFAWNRAYCQPPLSRDEVVTIFYSIAMRESARRLRREESR